MYILETRNLTKHFDGVCAVDGLSISFKKGTITSVVGPNGSGKTTLMHLLSGMIPFDAGKIVVQGKQFFDLPSYAVLNQGITRTFQEVRLFNQMTVLDNVLVVLTDRRVLGSIFKKHRASDLRRAEVVLQEMGIWEKRNALAGTLSYGQRKLLEIARTRAVEANVFLYDEPFAGLFPEMRAVVVEVLKKLSEQGKTVIVIEHNMELVRALSDHVFVMDSGRLLASGTPTEALNRPEVIEAYLGK